LNKKTVENALAKEIRASKSKEKEDKWSQRTIELDFPIERTTRKTIEKCAKTYIVHYNLDSNSCCWSGWLLSPWFSNKSSSRYAQVHGVDYGLHNMGSIVNKIVGTG
jgi:hypothetical protein